MDIARGGGGGGGASFLPGEVAGNFVHVKPWVGSSWESATGCW